jgi:hypothetical protein
MKKQLVVAATLATAITAVAVTSAATATTSFAKANADPQTGKPVSIEVFTPEREDNVGVSGFGWLVDMEVDFPAKGLRPTGFTGLQLTGPKAHDNTAPFPGVFSPGQDDRMPGLVVLVSTTNSTMPGFSGPGTNLANLFNITGVTNRDANETELWDTWIVGAAIAGKNVDATLTVAEVKDLNHDGIYNDAPNVVPDLNHDGRVNADDLRLLGVASNIITVPFHINGDAA